MYRTVNDVPYFLESSLKVFHGMELGISSAFPMIGRAFGPGGNDTEAAALGRDALYRISMSTIIATNTMGSISRIRVRPKECRLHILRQRRASTVA